MNDEYLAAGFCDVDGRLYSGGEETLKRDTAAALDRYMGEKYGELRTRRRSSSRVHSESYRAGKAQGGRSP